MKKFFVSFLLSLFLVCPSFAADYTQSHSGGGSLTNVTDCGKYATLQACVDAAGSYGYAHAPGTYTAGIALTNAHAGLTIDLAGSGYIHIAAGDAVTITGTADNNRAAYITIKNGRIKADAALSHGINNLYVDYSRFSNLDFNGSPYISILLENASFNTVEKSRFLNNGNLADGDIGDIVILDGVTGGAGTRSRENRIDGNVISGAAKGGLVVHHFNFDYTNSQKTFITNNYFNAVDKCIYVGNGTQEFTGNNYYACGYGIYGDASYTVASSNAFTACTIGIHEMDAEGAISNNIFNNCTTNMDLQPWFVAAVSNNMFIGGANVEQPNSHTFIAGDQTTISSGYGSGFIGGSAGIGAKGYHLFSELSNATAFNNVLPGDVLHLPMASKGGLFRVKSVTDGQNLVFEEVYPYFPYPGGYGSYQLYRGVTYIDTFGNLSLSPTSIIKGGGHRITESIIPAAVTTGSVAAINAAPTAAGTGYALNDLVMIGLATGDATREVYSGDAVVKVTGVGALGAVTSVALVDSGQYGYTVGTGKATKIVTGDWGAASGLTVNITAVGLSVAQVSDTILVNTGQAAADITNYLPTAKSGYKFRSCVITPQTNHFWAFNNNSGILNNASGDVTALAGSDGTAGSTHGIKFGSGATNLVKGDCADFWTANIDATNGYYQWFVQKVVGTTTITAY